MKRSNEEKGQPVYVIGHRNPDTDAICSALGYASFLSQTRIPDATAACCGEINDRTAWVLKYAGVSAPRLVMDVRATALSICRKDLVTATPEETFLEVYQKMSSERYRSLPVLNPDGTVAGMPTFLELLQLLMPGGEVRADARYVHADLKNIVRTLEGALDNPPAGNGEEELVMVVGASSVKTASARIGKFPAKKIIMLVGDRPKVQELAITSGIYALVLTGGFSLSAGLAAAAAEKGVAVIACKHDTATAAQLIRFSRRVAGILSGDFRSFGGHALVSRIVDEVQDVDQPLFPVIDEDSDQLVGVFSKSDLIDPPTPQLVLVDHNEFSQAVRGADEAEVIEVIDHHRLSGNLVSKEPVRFVNEPVGSTSTIVATFFRQEGIEPERGIAVCLVAGIVADTLSLTSPTTTDIDRDILPWLAGIAGVEIAQFTKDFFAAGSALRTQLPAAAIGSDRKEFTENGWGISISQIEELGLEEFWRQEADLQQALVELCRDQQLDFACLMVTDITKHYSLLVTAGDPRVIDEIEYPELRRNLYEMRGIVSRKKQLFPYIGRILGRLAREVG